MLITILNWTLKFVINTIGYLKYNASSTSKGILTGGHPVENTNQYAMNYFSHFILQAP